MALFSRNVALWALLPALAACADDATTGGGRPATTTGPATSGPVAAAGGRGPLGTAGMGTAPVGGRGGPISPPPGGASGGPATPMGGAGAAPAPAIGGMGGSGEVAGAPAPSTGGSDEKLEGKCPDGYKIQPGLNRDFPSAGLQRAFYVVLPSDTSKPMPVWVPLTGTEESTQQNMEVQRSGNNKAVAEGGYIVLGPVRICANQDPTITNRNCSGLGPEPYMYIPWRDGASTRSRTSDAVYKEAGPDSVFFEDMVRCVAAHYPVLKNKLYLGGISAGGSMTHRALTFNSKFWAGGMPISGEWRTSTKDGGVLGGNQAETQMQSEPKGIFPGRTPPFPLPTLDPMVVITVRGGPSDMWPGTAYKPDAQASSNFYASQSNVVSVVCNGNWGHQWPKDMANPDWTNKFNRWAVDLMASHPKGTPVSQFKLTTPPEGAGFSCKLGRFDILYD